MPIAKSVIRTVLGDIAPSDLGNCYGHEHLLGQPPPQFSKADLVLDDREMALNELRGFQAVGGRSIVEMTTPDYGRDAAGLRWLAEQSGVNIIAATGYNHEKFSTPFLENASVDELAARYIHAVTVGMDGTSARAGLIKASSPLNAISALAEKMLRSAAQAHHATGAPISTHTEAGTMALEQVAVLTGAGVTPSHIVIGHLDRRLDWDYHLEMARTGAFLGYDQISKEKYYSDALRAEFITRLFDAGHGQQILLSGDLARRSYWHSYSGGAALGLRFILSRFVPLLKECGCSEEMIHTLLVDNPARAFAFLPVSHLQ